MRKINGASIALLVVGIACLSSAALLRSMSTSSREHSRLESGQTYGRTLSASFATVMPNYSGYSSTDICAGNPFNGRNNNMKTAVTCRGFPGSGCYACDPDPGSQVALSGIQSNGGSGVQPAGGTNGTCSNYSLFQGVCRSNMGNYYCEPLIDQLMKCVGQFPYFDTQIIVLAPGLGDESSSRGTGKTIVVR